MITNQLLLSSKHFYGIRTHLCGNSEYRKFRIGDVLHIGISCYTLHFCLFRIHGTKFTAITTINKVTQDSASLIGPNCIGLMNTWHHSVFSQPIPQLHPQGVDLISSSGATAVFILESAVTKGLQFNSVWSVGNAKQIGVEDVLQYMDENFQAEKILK